MKTLRATLNKYPQRTRIVTSGIILLVVLFIVWRLFGTPNPITKAKSAFYTDDDGETVFKDKPNLIVPFDHNGKPAVLAWVYTADHGKHQWVHCLVKYTDESAKRLAALAAESSKPTPTVQQMAAGDMPNVLLKRPGPTAAWIHMNDPKARELMEPASVPDGMGPGPIEQVFAK